MIILFLLEDMGAGKVRLTIEEYIARNPVRQLLYAVERKKKKEALQRSMERLEQDLDISCAE